MFGFGPPGKPSRGFPTTSWTLLSLARGGGSQAQSALEELLARYGAPVRAFLRSALRISLDEVDDVAQDFFIEKVLSGRLLNHYERGKGSFRPFLKEALRNYVRSRNRHNAAQRRSPGGGMVHADQLAGGWDTIDRGSPITPEAAFHAEWVRRLLEEALCQVRAKCEDENLMQHYAVFEQRYISQDPPPKWSQLGAPFGWDEKQARNRADIVSDRFRAILIKLVEAEAGSEQMAREEIEALLALL